MNFTNKFQKIGVLGGIPFSPLSEYLHELDVPSSKNRPSPPNDHLASSFVHEMIGAKVFRRENRPLRPDPMGFYLIFNIINSQAHQQPMKNKNAIYDFYSRIDSRCFPELRNDLF